MSIKAAEEISLLVPLPVFAGSSSGSTLVARSRVQWIFRVKILILVLERLNRDILCLFGVILLVVFLFLDLFSH